MSAPRFRRPLHHREPIHPQRKPGRNGWEEYRPATLRHSRKGLINAPRKVQAQIRRAFYILSDSQARSNKQATLCGIPVSDGLARRHAKRILGK